MWEAGGDYNDTLLDSISVSIPLAAIPSINASALGGAILPGDAYQLNTTASQSSVSPTASSSSPDLRHNGGQWRLFFAVIGLCAWVL